MTAFGPGNVEVHGHPAVLAPMGPRTAGGFGPTVVAGDKDTLRLVLDVTAASGATPSLTVTVQHSPDGTTWTTHSSFTARTAPGTERRVLPGVDNYVRATWAITGTGPSFTFAVSGELV